MAFKLTAAQRLELRSWQDTLRHDRERMERAFDVLRSELVRLPFELNAAIRAHNVRLEAARAFIEAVAEEHRDAYDEKSDAWKDGDRGQADDAFVCDWESAELNDIDEVDLLLPDKPEWNESLNLPEEAD